MSEFGNETATATMRTAEKSLEAIFKLLRFISDMKKADAEIQRNKLQTEMIKKNKGEIKRTLDKVRGQIALNKLDESGEKTMPIAVQLTKNELKDFARYAKDFNVPFAAVAEKKFNSEIKEVKKKISNLNKKEKTTGLTSEEKDSLNKLQEQLKALNEKRVTYTIMIRAKDLEKINKITEKLNWNIAYKNIDDELTELKAKKNPTEEDLKRMDELEKEKEKFYKGEFDKYNKESSESATEHIKKDYHEAKNTDYETAVEDVCKKGEIVKPVYIVERENPNNYMEVTAVRKQSINDPEKTYINTKFNLFVDNQKQKCDEFEHGEFTRFAWENGQQSSDEGEIHWKNMKQEMKTKGEFSDDMLFFNNKEDFEKYKEEFNKAKEEARDSFKEALINAKNSEIHNNEKIYIVNGLKPNNYIEVEGKKYASEDEIKITKDFHLYKEGKIESTIHSDLLKDSWEEQIEKFRVQGEFDKPIYIFKDKEEFEKFRNEFDHNKQTHEAEFNRKESYNREDSSFFEGNTDSYKDYSGIINNLKGYLDDHNLMMNEQGNLLYKETNKPYVKNTKMTDDEKDDFLEAVNVAKQIGVLKQLNELQVKKAMAVYTLNDNERAFKEQGSPDGERREMFDKFQNKLKEDISNIESEEKKLSIEENELIHERNVYVSRDAYNNSHETYDVSMYEIDNEKMPDDIIQCDDYVTMSKDSWESNINMIKGIEEHSVNFTMKNIEETVVDTERE